MFEAGGGEQLGQRVQRGVVIIVDALDLVRHDQRAGAQSDPAWSTPVGQRSVWQLSDWMQPSANMKPRAELHQSAPIAIARAMSKAVAILPDGADLDAVARVDADQRVVDEIDALAHRHAQMVHEFQRRRAGAAFIAVDHDEVGIDAGLQHRLADRQKLPGMADAQLEAGRLAAGQPPHLADELPSSPAASRRRGA